MASTLHPVDSSGDVDKNFSSAVAQVMNPQLEPPW